MAEIEFVKQQKIFAIIRTESAELALKAAEAVIRGGIKLIEITLTTPQAYEVINKLANQKDIWVGAGSVTTTHQAQEAINAGAKFIISPIYEPAVVKIVQKQNIFVVTGGLTPTEIWQAQQLGVDLIKVFPVESVGGPNYIKYLLKPLPHLPILVSGGVTPQNAIAYLQSGVTAVGLASSLIDPEALQKNQLDKISYTAQNLVKSIQSYLWLKGKPVA